jgi:SAM-dependent methyltransferase
MSIEPTAFDPRWNEIYESRTRHMHYPSEEVIRFVMRHAPIPTETSVLELGCGEGNNLWFAAREGCHVAGIDASEQAIAYARQRCLSEGLAADFRVGDFTSLPFEGEKFDLVIDNGGLTCVGYEYARKAIREAHRVSKPGARFLFTPFSKNDSSYLLSDPGEGGVRVNIHGGTVIGVGQICFYSAREVANILSPYWEIKSLKHHFEEDMIADPPWVRAMWYAVATRSDVI